MTDVNLKTTGLFFLLFSLSVSSIAQEQQPRASFSHMAYLSAGRSNFDEEIAEQEGIEDDAATFRLAWMAQKNALIVGAGMGVFVYSDNQGFSQRVRSDYGSDYLDDSSASGLSVFGEVGYAFRASDAISLDAIAGAEAMFSSERSISYCSDCYSENIDIDTGAYIEPRFRVNANNGVIFMLSYRHYLSGDVENTFNVSLGWTFWDYL